MRRSRKGRWIALGLLCVAVLVGALVWARIRAERLEEEAAAIEEWTAGADVARPERIAGLCPDASRARIDSLLERFPLWSDVSIGHAACHRVVPGMTAEQVREAWGPPTAIQPSKNRGPDELWFYGREVTVFFWDGRVRNTQRFEVPASR